MVLARKNGRVGVASALMAVTMLGVTFASVPLYRLFCQVTGYGGTPQIALAAPGAVDERAFTIVFDANVGTGLPWEFRPAQRQVTVRAGEEGLAFYVAHNPTDRAIKGQAAFNVTPLTVGKYFSKVQCFCFEEQLLAPGQTIDMGVSFFVDPAILKDRNMVDLKMITLSYTFYEVPGQQAGLAGAATAAGGVTPAPVR